MDIGNLWQRTNSWRKKRRVQTFLAISLALFAPFLVFITFMVLRSTNGSVSNDLIRFVLLLDFIYVLVVGALVGQRILRMMIARSKKTAGSRLHLRLSGVFAFVAFARSNDCKTWRFCNKLMLYLFYLFCDCFWTDE